MAVLNSVAAWLRQTSTIVGIASICGAVSALATSQITWPAAVPIIVGAVVAMALPGHSDVSSAVAKVAADVAQTADAAKRAAAIQALGQDLPAALTDVAAIVPPPASTTVVVATSTTPAS